MFGRRKKALTRKVTDPAKAEQAKVVIRDLSRVTYLQDEVHPTKKDRTITAIVQTVFEHDRLIFTDAGGLVIEAHGFVLRAWAAGQWKSVEGVGAVSRRPDQTPRRNIMSVDQLRTLARELQPAPASGPGVASSATPDSSDGRQEGKPRP